MPRSKPLMKTRRAAVSRAMSREASHGTPAAPHRGTRRWIEQRWTLDNIIQSVGMDWDQPRSLYLSAPCGPQAAGDFAAVRQRIVKFADAAPAFEAMARKREGIASAAEKSGAAVTA